MKAELFQAEQDADILLIRPQHSISSLADADLMGEMDQLCTQLGQSNVKHVVIDFAAVEYFGSVMLEALRLLWNTVHAAQGQLALCNVSPVGREILEIAHFDKLWPVCDSRDAAVRTVRGES